MKQLIENLIKNSIYSLDKDGSVNPSLIANIRVDRTKDRAHGDFATNIAMILAKPLKKNPRQIAEDIIAALPKDDHISKVEIAGPGFINFFVNKDAISKALKDMSADPRLGIPKVKTPKTIVVDYSAPNVAKEMAVHHIRSTVIGDAVVRVLEFLGNNVIRANHIGDWGTQFGMLIAYLEKKENESGQGMDLSDFEAFYREAKECYDTDEEFAVKARHYVVLLQGGDEYCRKMWKKLVNMTMVQNQKLYDRLDVTLSDKDIMGESLYNDMLPEVVDDLMKRGIAVEDQGAVVVYLPQFKNKEGKPLGNIIRKNDGGYLYTTDIACAKYRAQTLKADRILYFTDSRQQQHLETVWAICKKAGYVGDNVSMEHCPFGMMLGKDGKPFKTRSGGTVKLRDVLDEAEARVTNLLKERNSTLSEDEKKQVIHNIAIGAVKYADLCKNRTTDYVFDWDQMLSFEGNTAPYLQYAYSRIRAIFRKAKDPSLGDIKITCDAEEDLANKILAFAEAVQSVGDKTLPNLLCNYIFELSNLFMHFYEACPILKDDVPEDVRKSRLALCDLTAKVLKQGLSLLGINVMEQM